MNPGRIITFYSYKGGVGRSFALANIAAILSSWGAQVLCVDWDLEAPGLHHFFPNVQGHETRYGLLPLLESSRIRDVKRGSVSAESPPAESLNWKSCFNKVIVDAAGNTIDFIPAGRDVKDYVRRVHALDWDAMYEKQDFGEFLEKLKREWTQNYDFVLLDSRTGLTDISGICTIHLPDMVVPVFTANHQSLGGTAYMSQRINEERGTFFYSSGQALIMPLLSRWEEKDAPDDAKEWWPRILDTIRPSFNVWRQEETSVERLAELLKIPYKAKWNFGEHLVLQEESETDPGSVSYHFHLIAAVLARDLADTQMLLSEPNKYRQLAMKESRNKRKPLDTKIKSEKPEQSFESRRAVTVPEEGQELWGERYETKEELSGQNYETILLKKLALLRERQASEVEISAIIADINELRSAASRPLLETPKEK